MRAISSGTGSLAKQPSQPFVTAPQLGRRHGAVTPRAPGTHGCAIGAAGSVFMRAGHRGRICDLAGVRQGPRKGCLYVASQGDLFLRHQNSNQGGLKKLASCVEPGACANRSLSRSASRCHSSRLAIRQSICAKRNFCIACNRSSSMRSSFISRRIAGTGSEGAGNCGAGAMRVMG